VPAGRFPGKAYQGVVKNFFVRHDENGSYGFKYGINGVKREKGLQSTIFKYPLFPPSQSRQDQPPNPTPIVTRVQ